ncbi:hypothetical protein [Natronoarchaeum philippinense]|nr:hypothetical protein [Natronoarchaeum philippinense]
MIAAYVVAAVWLSIGVNALSGEWIVGSYWFGALVGLIAVEQALERWLF